MNGPNPRPTDPMVLTCSPRAGGNSDTAAKQFSQAVRDAGGECEVMRLRDYIIMPCMGCWFCEKELGHCALDEKDQAKLVFNRLLKASFVFISSPIYYYHVPSPLKALIDRSQSYYMRRKKGDPTITGLPARKAYVCLVAGRERGEKLFDGALLSLKYFLKDFNITIAETLLFKGVEAAGDLAGDESRLGQIYEIGRKAWTDAQRAARK